jgi:hypothetical protein
LKAAVRDLANGVKGYEKYKKLLKDKFVFLNVYCTNVASEHEPRGPEGPFRFQDRSVPVIVFKRWDGKTLFQKLGFSSDPKAGRRTLAQYIDKALKENGPVVPPKALRPLLKSFAKGEEHLAKKRISSAIREFQAVVKGASNKKKFPDEQPDVARKARANLEALASDAETQLAAAATLAESDVKAAKKRYGKISREYGGLDGIREKVREALAGLK